MVSGGMDAPARYTRS